MSDMIGFQYNGSKEDWNEYTSNLRKEGKTVKERLSTIINRELAAYRGEAKEDSNTASKYQDMLRDSILEQDLRYVLKSGTYHVVIDDIEFIKSAKHDLSERVKGAVCSAIYHYWIRRWTTLRDKDPKQSDVLYAAKPEGVQFQKSINSMMRVTYDCPCVPLITLSDLREDNLYDVVQFECTIIGPSPKKFDSNTEKYIQKVLIQEPEVNARNNSPVVLKSHIHGDDTNNIASGQNKRIIGIYKTEDPVNGEKVKQEKALLIDCIKVEDIEEQKEVTLSEYDLAIAKQFANEEPDKYLDYMIKSFCPKIYGRRLEKLAIYLSLLGGSEYPGYRKESHLMLVGEADTGKSELVKFADQISNKSSIIDGSNATGIGILFALDEYDGIKILRAGAMILNNGGHIVIDEYDKMPKSEQKKLNQAQEQQRATYNKGGHVGNAETKTTVIAACNPNNESWKESDTLIDNLPFDSSTFTRFDVIIRLTHENHENQVRAKMQHILSQKRGNVSKVADVQYLKGLLNHQRKQRPIITEEAEELLVNKFVEFTQIEQSEGSIVIQTRQMEGIQRLCEAWAKMHFKKQIDTDIIEKVINFYSECMETLGMKTKNGVSQMDLRGNSINRDDFFEETFKNLSMDDDDGYVYSHILDDKLKDNEKFFRTDRSVSMYIESKKKQGWLFEPRPGVLKRS